MFKSITSENIDVSNKTSVINSAKEFNYILSLFKHFCDSITNCNNKSMKKTTSKINVLFTAFILLFLLGGIQQIVAQDFDGDGVLDATDLDDDNDGILDDAENACVITYGALDFVLNTNDTGGSSNTNSGTFTDGSGGSGTWTLTFSRESNQAVLEAIEVKDGGNVIGVRTAGNSGHSESFTFSYTYSGTADLSLRLYGNSFGVFGGGAGYDTYNLTYMPGTITGIVSDTGNEITPFNTGDTYNSGTDFNQSGSHNNDDLDWFIDSTSGITSFTLLASGGTAKEGFAFSIQTVSATPGCTNADLDGNGKDNSQDYDADGDGCFDVDEVYGLGFDTNNDGTYGGIPTLGNSQVNANGLVIAAGTKSSGTKYTTNNFPKGNNSDDNIFEAFQTSIISGQQADQEVITGNGVTLNAPTELELKGTNVAVGNTPVFNTTEDDVEANFTYQWQYNDPNDSPDAGFVDLSGATSATFNITTIAADDANTTTDTGGSLPGTYKVLISHPEHGCLEDDEIVVTLASPSDIVLAEIGIDADANSSDVSIAELNSILPALTDVTSGNLTAYQTYIGANAGSFDSPATQAQVQAMITAVNAQVTATNDSNTVLAEIGIDADANSSDVSIAELNSILPALTDVTSGNLTAYQTYIGANAGSFDSPATQAQVQAMITAVNTLETASTTVLAEIGIDADANSSDVSIAELNSILPALTDVTSGNLTAYQTYIGANAGSFDSPATQAQVQAMITAVNTLETASTTVLAEIGIDADANSSDVSIAELNSILPALTDVTSGNLTAYQTYIGANAGSFDSPATQAEVQAMITAVNTLETASTTVLVEIGIDADANSSDVSIAELNSILPALTDVTSGNLTAYQTYIGANAGSFDSPATQAQVQAMITAVNTLETASTTVLAEIGIDADANSSDVSIAELNSILPALTDVTSGNLTAYQTYIGANAGSFDSPATQAEVQAMITAVNAAVIAAESASDVILTQIGTEADASTSAVTIAQLGNILPALTSITAANETAYQAYLNANAASIDSPAIQAQVQTMITAVNAAVIAAESASDTILAQIGTEADASTSAVTIAQLGDILPALTSITAANEAAYQAYLNANAASIG